MDAVRIDVDPPQPVPAARCRGCGASLTHVFVDLGMSPLCETYLAEDELNRMEPFYPLKVFVCDRCWLVQLEEYVSPEGIFGHYPYFSSYSDSWLRHAERYVQDATERFALGPNHRVVEVGSNDGYLLQYFVARGVPALGVEPAANVAEAARARGVETRVGFFGTRLAEVLAAEGWTADLVLGNNVLAQVPDLHDFVAGLDDPARARRRPHARVPSPGPAGRGQPVRHDLPRALLLLLADEPEPVLAAHGLQVFDVEELATHGGSLRLYIGHTDGPLCDLGQRASDRASGP